MPHPVRTAFAALAGILALAGCHNENSDTRADASPATHATPAKVNLLVGTYTEGPASSGKSKGIPVFRFDTATGEARQVALAIGEGVRNPSWLVVSPSGRHVYAVNELNGTGKSGEVAAFDFDPATGVLKFINKVSSEGDDPCHLLWDGLGSEMYRYRNGFSVSMGNPIAGLPGPCPGGMLYVSNYSAGGMVAIPIELDGKLKPASTNPEDPRLAPGPGSHIHSTIQPRSPSCLTVTGEGIETSTRWFPGRGYFVQDLGTDTIHTLFRPGGCYSKPYNRSLKLPDKTGPRHLIFDTNGRHAFVVGELNDTVTPLDYRDEVLFPQAPVHLGAPVEPGKGTAAAIHLSDDGKFLYASTRNPKNIIVVFSVDRDTGRLEEIQTVSSGGKAPREFTIAPGGKFLLVANQQSDAIAVFSRDPETGKISDTGRRIEVGTPVDLKWAPAQ